MRSETLADVVREAAKYALPSCTEDWHLELFIRELETRGVTVKKRRKKYGSAK